jgi:hypothetical protein
MSEERKTVAFFNRLKSGNTAEEWHDALPIRDKATWATIKATFLVHWPKKTVSLRSTHDKSNCFKEHILKEELGVWQEEDGRKELSHVLWAVKILTLTNNVPNPAGLLKPEVRHPLPIVIHKCIESEFPNWDDFVRVIKVSSKSSINNALEKDKKLRSTINKSCAATVAACTLLQQSPTVPLHHMLCNTTISQYS